MMNSTLSKGKYDEPNENYDNSKNTPKNKFQIYFNLNLPNNF